MSVAYTIIAVLWLAVVTSRAEEDCSNNRCSPSPQDFTVEVPGHYQYNVKQPKSCDYKNMMEISTNTGINTAVEDGVCNGESYLMTDRNWMNQDPYEPNIASAFHLPPVEGCRWELWLLKRFDRVVGDNNCNCKEEDHVHFDDGNPLHEKTYCDFTDPPESTNVGWCSRRNGLHNVHIQPAFTTDVNTGVLTTFHSDNCNRHGGGGMVFAYAVRSTIGKRSVRQTQLPSAQAPNPWLIAYCWKYYFLCNFYRRCNNYPCECYTNTTQRVTCTLYAIFTDATGRTAVQNSRSCDNVTRWAARHALSNIGRFGRPVPTYTQLQRNTTTTTPTPTSTSCPRTDPTKSTPKTTSSTTLRPTPHPPKRPKTHLSRFPPRRTTIRPILRYRTRG